MSGAELSRSPRCLILSFTDAQSDDGGDNHAIMQVVNLFFFVRNLTSQAQLDPTRYLLAMLVFSLILNKSPW